MRMARAIAQNQFSHCHRDFRSIGPDEVARFVNQHHLTAGYHGHVSNPAESFAFHERVAVDEALNLVINTVDS